MKRHRLAVPLFLLLGWLAPLVARATLADSPETVHPLTKGTPAPSAVVTSAEGQDTDLSSIVKGKPTILVFYRGSWCPFCNTHLAALGEAYPQLQAMGYQIVGITPDNLKGLATMAEKHQLPYKLYSDRSMRVSDAFGVAYRVKAQTVAFYKERGISLAPVPGQDDYWLPVPSAFIVGRDGVIQFVYYNPDYKVRIPTEALVAAAKEAINPGAP